MSWSPVNYGGIKEMRVSPDKVWLPDIVGPSIHLNLFTKFIHFRFSSISVSDSIFLSFHFHFSADGNYEVSFMSNVIIDYQGNVLWVPPAIYKSSCIIGLAATLKISF
jgi:nicotinic acetylcholine receptor, invertebrate